MVLAKSSKIRAILFSRANFAVGETSRHLLFSIFGHVGILALWVHPSDNIHGYIPLSILVLAGRVTVER